MYKNVQHQGSSYLVDAVLLWTGHNRLAVNSSKLEDFVRTQTWGQIVRYFIISTEFVHCTKMYGEVFKMSKY